MASSVNDVIAKMNISFLDFNTHISLSGLRSPQLHRAVKTCLSKGGGHFDQPPPLAFPKLLGFISTEAAIRVPMDESGANGSHAFAR
jgi:hypothetical protein